MNIHIRSANQQDVPIIATLVNGFAAKDLMLPRSEESIFQSLPNWTVAVEEGHPQRELIPASSQLLGCGSLVGLTEQLAEIRSLAVATKGQGKGIGRRIVQELVRLAKERGFAQICALTLQEAFFEKLGFQIIDRWSISPKLWQECIYCPKFHRCDEVAVARNLRDDIPIDEANTAQTSAWAPLLKWQAWQPLKLAYNKKPIQLDEE